MMTWRAMIMAWTVVLCAIPLARAQDGPTKVATCNIDKVLASMDEAKAVGDKLRAERERAKVEAERRNAEVRELAKQRDDLKPESAQFKEKTRQIMAKAVEGEVWLRLTLAELTRAEKAEISRLMEVIRITTKELAEARKIDLVLVEHKPAIPDSDQVSSDQFRALMINQTDVLFATARVDITSDVTVAVNKKYVNGAAGK